MQSEYTQFMELTRRLGIVINPSSALLDDKDGSKVTAADRRKDALPRSAQWVVPFGTTSLYFTIKGVYVGCVQVGRDGCNYFTPRGSRSTR